MIGRSFANIQHTYNYAHWACMCGGLADTLCCLCGTSITNTLGLGVLLPFLRFQVFFPVSSSFAIFCPHCVFFAYFVSRVLQVKKQWTIQIARAFILMKTISNRRVLTVYQAHVAQVFWPVLAQIARQNVLPIYGGRIDLLANSSAWYTEWICHLPTSAA